MSKEDLLDLLIYTDPSAGDLLGQEGRFKDLYEDRDYVVHFMTWSSAPPDDVPPICFEDVKILWDKAEQCKPGETVKIYRLYVKKEEVIADLKFLFGKNKNLFPPTTKEEHLNVVHSADYSKAKFLAAWSR